MQTAFIADYRYNSSSTASHLDKQLENPYLVLESSDVDQADEDGARLSASANSNNGRAISGVSGQTDWQKYSIGSEEDILSKSSSSRRLQSRYVETSEPDPHMLVKICALCFIAYLGEGSVGDWSGIFLTDEGASPIVCTMGFVGFQVLVAIGRYYSDFLVMEIGRRNLLMLSGLVASVGLIIVVIASSAGEESAVIAVAIVGFSICGAGLSVVAPSAISLAGSEIPSTVMASSEAIGYVSSIG